MQERLQKIISQAGIASRRAGEEIILAGRVRVNGRIVTELGAKADIHDDTIEVDGRRLIPEAPRYLVLHKPRGVVSTLSDPEGRPTVAGLLEGAGTRLYPVGRLDFATSGVLLVTNDGEFANGLLHPRGGVPKTYVVKAKGTMSPEDLERWEKGVDLEDGRTLPAHVSFLRHEEDKTWFEITLREGRNQQIRRMGEATGFHVMRLARTSFAGITSENLRPGQWRPLTLDELLDLRKQFGVPRRVRSAATPPPQQRGSRHKPASHAATRAPSASHASPARTAHAGPRSRFAGEEERERRAPHSPAKRERGAGGVRGPRADQGRGPRADQGRGPRVEPRTEGSRAQIRKPGGKNTERMVRRKP